MITWVGLVLSRTGRRQAKGPVLPPRSRTLLSLLLVDPRSQQLVAGCTDGQVRAAVQLQLSDIIVKGGHVCAEASVSRLLLSVAEARPAGVWWPACSKRDLL